MLYALPMDEKDQKAKARTTIRLPADLYAKLDNIKKRTGAPIQYQVVKAVESYLKGKRGA